MNLVFKVQAETYANEFQLLEPGLLLQERVHHWSEPVAEESETLGHFWGLAYFIEDQDNISIIKNEKRYSGRRGMVVFCPPFEVYSFQIQPGITRWKGYFSKEPLPEKMPKKPILFYLSESNEKLTPPHSLEEIFDLVIRNKPHWHDIQKRSSASPLARITKRYLDEVLYDDFRLIEIATKLNCSLSLIDREFKKCYGLSPSRYRKTGRLISSAFNLVLEGATVSEIGVHSGFGDIDNFTKQFRSVLRATPQQFKPPPFFFK